MPISGVPLAMAVCTVPCPPMHTTASTCGIRVWLGSRPATTVPGSSTGPKSWMVAPTITRGPAARTRCTTARSNCGVLDDSTT